MLSRRSAIYRCGGTGLSAFGSFGCRGHSSASIITQICRQLPPFIGSPFLVVLLL